MESESITSGGSVDERFCRMFAVCPGGTADGRRQLLVSDDSDLSVLGYLTNLWHGRPVLKRVSSTELSNAMESLYDKGAKRLPDVDGEANAQPSQGVIETIDNLIRECLDERASDIHFEPKEAGLLCRARIDGLLVDIRQLPGARVAEFISRLKIMSGLDIAEKRRPQDGRIRFRHKDRGVDIRVSVIPTEFGEKVVLRLLDKSQLKLDLSELGFSDEQLLTFRDRISLSHGLILVTGPTGSGKTTTLYAALTYLKSPEMNISTVEDPIEYDLAGINQTHVRPEINLTFAAMLRSLLRQDPNIIMVGEIRDNETLEMALRASMTGHLVFSTIHTNSAIGTIARLVDMGAEPYLVASSLKLIVAQRLIRKNCPDCFEIGLDEANLEAASILKFDPGIKAGHSRGCNSCRQTGFHGRTAVYELLPINSEIKDAISRQSDEQTVLELARCQSFTTMAEAAAELVASGVICPVEVLRELRS